MQPKSIRWRLSLSYAGIALLATLLLGAIMLTILQQYYADQELEYLVFSGSGIEQKITALQASGKPPELLKQMLTTYAFFSNTQVRLIDPAGNLILDTGLPQEQTALAFEAFSDSDKFTGYDAGFTIISKDPFIKDVEFTEIISGSYPADEILILESSLSDISGWVIGTSYKDNNLLISDESDARSNQKIDYPYFDQDGKNLGIIELSNGPAYGRAILRSVAWGWGIAALAAVVLAAVVGMWVSRQFSTPLESLTHTTTQMAAGDLSARSNTERQDEFGQLSKSFNQMADTIETKVATLRRFVADAAHELGTPLTALRTNLELVEDEHIPSALTQVERMDTLTRNLLDLSQLETLDTEIQFEVVDLAALLQEFAETYASRAEQAELSFNLEVVGDPAEIKGNTAQLGMLIRNLLDNAVKFTPVSGQVHTKLGEQDDTVQLTIADTGIGIPNDDVPHLFSRFHRGSNAAAYPGSGLGLAIVKAIVDHHGASIGVESDTSGTVIVVQFIPYK